MGKGHGILMNGAGFARGRSGRAFSLDGSDQYVNIPNSPGLALTRQITIAFWMKADRKNTMGIYQGLVGSDFWGVEIANGYTQGPMGVSAYISTDRGKEKSAKSFPDTATANGGGAVIPADEWHHIAATYDGTQLQLHINGRPSGKPVAHSGAISPMLADSFMAIGSADGRSLFPHVVGARYFNGLIDEVAIYNRALSSNEIATLFNADGGVLPAASDAAASAVHPGLVARRDAEGNAEDSVNPPSVLPRPVAWWPADVYASDLVGLYNGILQQGITLVTGKVENAFQFAGAGSRIEIGDAENLRFTNSFSIVAWIWINKLPTAAQEQAQIFFRGDRRPGVDPYYLAVLPDGRLRFHIGDENELAPEGTNLVTPPIPTQQWRYVWATFDATSGAMRVYADGRLLGETNTSQRPFSRLAPGFQGGVAIGNQISAGQDQPFDGMIDELVVFDGAFSEAQIRAGYEWTNPPPRPGLLLNLDCGGYRTASEKTGFAAIGQTPGDFWNYYGRDGTNGHRVKYTSGTFLQSGWLPNLKLADGTATSIALTVTNGPGRWSAGSWDEMLNDYICTFEESDLVLTFTNLPAGDYDVYLYSVSPGRCRINAGSVNLETSFVTPRYPARNPPAWEEGVDYVRFREVQVSRPDQPVTITLTPNKGERYAALCGLQIATSAPESRAARGAAGRASKESISATKD